MTFRLGIDNPHFIQCQRKITALTTVDGHWPPDGGLWKAGSPAAWDQLKDMARVFIADVRRTDDRHPHRLWDREDARFLLIQLCEALLDVPEMYADNRWCRTLLDEINPTGMPLS